MAQNSMFTRTTPDWDETIPGRGFVRHAGSSVRVKEFWVRDAGLWRNVWNFFIGTLRPDGDQETSGWTATPLYLKLDEVTPDDATTEITSGTVSSVCPSNTVHDFEVRLSNPSIAPTGGEVITLRIRAWLHEVSGLAITAGLRVQLKEGTSVRATLNTGLSKSAYATASMVLSQSEKDSIANWDNLFVNVRTTVCVENPGNSAHSHVRWIELEFA